MISAMHSLFLSSSIFFFQISKLKLREVKLPKWHRYPNKPEVFV